MFLQSFFTFYYLIFTMFNVNPAFFSFLFKLYLLRDEKRAPPCVCTAAKLFKTPGSEMASRTEAVKHQLASALVRNGSLCCKKSQGHPASTFLHTLLLFPPRNFVCIDVVDLDVLLQNFQPSCSLNGDSHCSGE